MKIPLSRLTPHPDVVSNPSRTLIQKLKAHIQATALYPPLIVRTLDKSKRFARRNGEYQVIDGHVRLRILKELNFKSADVVSFGPLSDRRTDLLLLTLNRLRSHDSPQKRAKLIDRYAQDHNLSLNELTKTLPDTQRTLERLHALVTQAPAVRKTHDPQNTARPFAVYLTPQQHQLLSKAINAAKKQSTQRRIADALETLARNFLKNDEPRVKN